MKPEKRTNKYTVSDLTNEIKTQPGGVINLKQDDLLNLPVNETVDALLKIINEEKGIASQIGAQRVLVEYSKILRGRK